MRTFLVLCGLLITASVIAADAGYTETFETLDQARWQTHLPVLGSGVILTKDGLQMTDRAYVLDRTPFVKGTLEVKFEYEDKNEKAEDSLAYADYMTVVLHTTGKVAAQRAYEPLDGIRVRVDAGHGKVEIGFLGEKAPPKSIELPRAEGAVALDPNTPHTLTVKDDGKTIEVSVNGRVAVKRDYDAKKFKGQFWTMSNRENVNVAHILKVKQVVRK